MWSLKPPGSVAAVHNAAPEKCAAAAQPARAAHLGAQAGPGGSTHGMRPRNQDAVLVAAKFTRYSGMRLGVAAPHRLEGRNSSYPTLCRRHREDQNSSHGKARKKRQKCRPGIQDARHAAISGTFRTVRLRHFWPQRRYGTASRPKLSTTARYLPLAVLRLRVLLLLRRRSWPRLHALAANMDRVCPG